MLPKHVRVTTCQHYRKQWLKFKSPSPNLYLNVHSCRCFCCRHCVIIKAEAWRALVQHFTVLNFSWLLRWGRCVPPSSPVWGAPPAPQQSCLMKMSRVYHLKQRIFFFNGVPPFKGTLVARCKPNREVASWLASSSNSWLTFMPKHQVTPANNRQAGQVQA